MDYGEWDLMSIVNSCKSSTSANPNITFETSPQTSITITTNNIITPRNITLSSTMDNGEWDLMSIVNSCKASTSANPTITFETSPQTPITITTNNIITPQNITPSYFNDFTVIQENNPSHFTPQKPTDSIDIERINFNHNNTHPFPTTIIPNPTSTSSPMLTTTTLTSLTTTIPTYNTAAPFDRTYNHQSVLEQHMREHNQLPILLLQTPITITTTNNIIPTQNTTPSHFKDFTIIQDNNLAPSISLKPTDFIDLEKVRVNFNHNNTLPIPTTIIPNLTTITTPTTSIPTIVTTTTSSPIAITTTPTSLTTTMPTCITTAHANHMYDHSSIPKQPLRQSNQLQFLLPQTPITTTINNIISPQNTTSSYFDSFTCIQENNSVPLAPFKPSEFVDQNRLRMNFNHNTIIPITTKNIPNPITIENPTTSIPAIISTTTTTSYSISTAIIPASSTTTILTHNTTSSRVLPNTHPQQPKFKSRKRKNYNQVSLVCHVKEGNFSKDSWKWTKYGQKPIKRSPHPRSYYKCNTLKDCPARKLVEKSKVEENTYVVTYVRVHNHEKWLVNQNSRK